MQQLHKVISVTESLNDANITENDINSIYYDTKLNTVTFHIQGKISSDLIMGVTHQTNINPDIVSTRLSTSLNCTIVMCYLTSEKDNK